MAMALGVYDYLAKPVEWARLSRTLTPLRRLHGAKPVLIVDDDPATREQLERTLRKDDWQVIAATNGRLALDLLKTAEPGLVLLDLMMPEMDGFEFLNRFRQDPRFTQTPVIVLTAKDITPEDRERLSGRVSEVIAKNGFAASKLLPQLHAYVNQAKAPGHH